MACKTATFFPWISAVLGKECNPQMLLTSFSGQGLVDSANLSPQIRCFTLKIYHCFTPCSCETLLSGQRKKQVTPWSTCTCCTSQAIGTQVENGSCSKTVLPPRVFWGENSLRSRGAFLSLSICSHSVSF